MSDNIEQIEARLCAYVDGELSPAERAEIEQHLAANPAHMVLIHDLIAQRAMVRQLPREKAPSDLSELLQSQLEREALLGKEPLADDAPSLRINRFPQLLSIAAIVLLTIGLGAVVYLVLPTGNPGLTLAPQPPLPALKPQPAAEVAAAKELKQDDTPVPAAQTPESSNPTILAHGAVGADAQMLVITIKAEDLTQANDDVVRFLSTNNIAWSEPEPTVLAQLTEEVGGAVSLPQGIDLGGVGGQVAMRGGMGAPMADRAPVRRMGAPVMAGGVPEAEQVVAAVKAPAADEAVTAQAEKMVVARDSMAAPASHNVVRPVALASGMSGRGSRVILARNLNGRQVTELTTTLSRSQRSAGQDRAHGVVLQVADVLRRERVAEEQKVKTMLDGDAGAVPATQPVPASMPATQPVLDAVVLSLMTPATQPAEGTYTCVIVLEGHPASEQPTTMPTTQPTLETPATQPVE